MAPGPHAGGPPLQALRLPYLRPSARLDDAALEHMVALFERVRELVDARPGRRRRRRPGERGARAANAAMRDEMRKRDNYFEEIEQAAGEALDGGRLLRPRAPCRSAT